MKKAIIFLTFLLLTVCVVYSQKISSEESTKRTEELLEDAAVKSSDKGIDIIIRNVDISEYPLIKIIVEAYNRFGFPLDTMYSEDLTVVENGVEKKVLSVEKISVHERVPVDFLFLIDKTGSMQKYINAVRRNISSFTTSLVRRGIDYNLGLVLFSDVIESKYSLSDNVLNFLSWLNNVQAHGGMDEKENALEALETACKYDFRPAANKVVVLITDAPYHQYGEEGEGVTDQTTGSIIKSLKEKNIRVFAISPPRLKEYSKIAKKTRGNVFDIDYPFSTILDNFSNQLTSVYAIKYRTDQEEIPDSINISLLNEENKQLVRRTIPIVELGRKLIIENLLYETASYNLPDSVAELQVLTKFMKNRPNVVILVEGHTDSRGSYALNDRLSEKRAMSVKRYLVKKGIDASRIRIKGYGERKPIATNSTEWGRQLNRRTEIVIVAK